MVVEMKEMNEMDETIQINGALKEGGGQILRNSITYAVLLQTQQHQQRPVTISNIRANRSNPGLRPQHLTGIALAVEIGNATNAIGSEWSEVGDNNEKDNSKENAKDNSKENAKDNAKDNAKGMLVGGEIGSTSVTYFPTRWPQVLTGKNSSSSSMSSSSPSKHKVGMEGVKNSNNPNNANSDVNFKADTGTAGSTALLLQTSMLPAFVHLLKLYRRRCWDLSKSFASATSTNNVLPSRTLSSSSVPSEPSVPSSKGLSSITVNLELRGGTNAEAAPQMEYVTGVLVPFINAYFQRPASKGLDLNYFPISPISTITPILEIDIQRRGYFPKGGGIVHAAFHPPAFLSGMFPTPNSQNSLKTPNNPISITSDTLAPTFPPITFPPIQLTQCHPIASLKIHAFHGGNCPSWIAKKMAQSALGELKSAWRSDPLFRRRFLDTGDCEKNGKEMSFVIQDAIVEIVHETKCIGPGSGIIIFAYPAVATSKDTGQSMNVTDNSTSCTNGSNCTNCPHCSTHCVTHCFTQPPPLAASAIGNRKASPQHTGTEAARELIEGIVSGGCVDRWMQDQLIPFMALADGTNGRDGMCGREGDANGSRVMSEILTGELTLHTQTAMDIAEKMTGCKFHVERLDDETISEYNQDGNSKFSKTSTLGNHDEESYPSLDSDPQQKRKHSEKEYGEKGRVLGRHMIRCEGIGFQYG